MARTVLTLLFLLSFLAPLLVSGATFAQVGEQAYIVHDVKVDTLAESAVKARDKAFGEAQMVAFRMLATRYYSPDEMTSFVSPDAQTVAGMVQDFEVVSEQLSTKRYVGTYTFRFKANAVNRYFKRAPQYLDSVAATPQSRAGLLIFPFFQYGDAAKPTTVLWDAAKNPWLRTWQKTSLDGNPSLVLPAGDASDVMDVRDTQFQTYNPVALKRMMARYSSRDAVILLAKFNPSATPPLQIDIYRTDKAQPELHKSIPVPAGNAKVLSELLVQAVAATKLELAGNWKLQTIVEDAHDADVDADVDAVDRDIEAAEDVAMPKVEPKPYTPAGGQVRVQTRFNTLSEWLAIRRSLNTVPALSNVRIVALKSNEAIVDLNYADWSALNSGLGAKGLAISGSGSGTYQLTGRPAPMPYR